VKEEKILIVGCAFELHILNSKELFTTIQIVKLEGMRVNTFDYNAGLRKLAVGVDQARIIVGPLNGEKKFTWHYMITVDRLRGQPFSSCTKLKQIDDFIMTGTAYGLIEVENRKGAYYKMSLIPDEHVVDILDTSGDYLIALKSCSYALLKHKGKGMFEQLWMFRGLN